MKKNTNSAFTLVELIVVITILAVLGTIAFISLQGYSADARNSKRTSDINNIQSAMWIKQAEGSSLMAFVGAGWGLITPAPSIAWATAGDATKYNVGAPNYTALGVKEDEFKDPTGQEYKIGATTTSLWKMEISASIESGAERTALVKGTYAPRTADPVTFASFDDTIVVLATADTNTFKSGDTTDLGVIKKVSRDGLTLTLDTTVPSGTTTIQLAAAETLGLIADKDTPATPVENGGTALAY